MNTPIQRFDPISGRVIEVPQDQPSIYQLHPNKHNGIDIAITLGGLTVSFNTNEQRLVHMHHSLPNPSTHSSRDTLSALRAAAGREPSAVPDPILFILDRIVDHHKQSDTRGHEAHWYKVSSPYCEGDVARVDDQDVEALSEELLGFIEALRQAEIPHVSVPRALGRWRKARSTAPSMVDTGESFSSQTMKGPGT